MRIVIPKDLTLPPIPAGTYRARVTDNKYKTSQSSGKPMLQLTYTILTPSPIAEINTVNRKAIDLIPITEETLWRLNMVFKACTGADLPAGQDFSVEELINFVVGQVMMKEVIISTDNEEYQGQLRTRIKGVNPVV